MDPDERILVDYAWSAVLIIAKVALDIGYMLAKMYLLWIFAVYLNAQMPLFK